MTRKKSSIKTTSEKNINFEKPQKKIFKLEYKNEMQKTAYNVFQQCDVLFLLGPAGSGKTFLGTAFAISEILAKKKSSFIITRPLVEAGEKLGYLPGTFEEKVDPYMYPIYDSINQLVGRNTQDREKIDKSIEIAPLAFLRGRTFFDSVCILDEAQNASYSQLKLFLTRLGDNSKIIITGDPRQSDLLGPVALAEITTRLKGESQIGFIEFSNDCIIRHPLVGKILEKLEA